MKVLIMAGGRGSRMGALTEHTPKCLLPVKGKPIVQHTIEKVREAGISDITIACHYLPEVVQSTLGSFAVDYIIENEPYGTAGALAMIPRDDILVINGDTLFDCDLRGMMEVHRKTKSLATIAAFHHRFVVPWGVVETDLFAERMNRLEAVRIHEQPAHDWLCMAGLYVISKRVLPYVKGKMDMPALLNILCDKDGPVTVWDKITHAMNVNTPQDLETANELEWT